MQREKGGIGDQEAKTIEKLILVSRAQKRYLIGVSRVWIKKASAGELTQERCALGET